VDRGTGLLAGDPPAGAVGGRHPTVQRRGGLPHHEGPVLSHPGEPRGQRAVLGLGLLDPELDVDPRRAQPIGSSAGEPGRLGHGDDDAGDTGGDQRVGAGTGAPGVRARLQGDDGGATASPLAGPGEGDDLGVRSAGGLRRALPHHGPVGGEDHGPDSGVRARRTEDGRAQLAGAGHAGRLGGGAHPRITAAACARRAAIAFPGSSAP
jgi:hypothetical protein